MIKPLARLIGKKKKDNLPRSGRRDIISLQILQIVKRIIRQNYEQLYAIDEFFERYKLSKLTQKEIDNPSSPLILKKFNYKSETVPHPHRHKQNTATKPRRLHW